MKWSWPQAAFSHRLTTLSPPRPGAAKAKGLRRRGSHDGGADVQSGGFIQAFHSNFPS